MLDSIKYLLSKVLKKSRFSAIKNSIIHSTAKVESGTSFINSRMERYSFCGYDCDIYHANIGQFTSIANNVVIGGARHPMEWVGMSPVFYAGRDSVKDKFSEHKLPPPLQANIGNDVWIGRSAIILSGVCVGDGAIVGAGSVVTKNIPAYSIYAGNPAKLIRYRFDESTIQQLKDIQWWNMSILKLLVVGKYITNPDEFFATLRDLNKSVALDKTNAS